MANRVLALTVDGEISYCTASPENRGKGKCNHVTHQNEGESEQEFIARVSEEEEICSYHMDDEEKEDLQKITGRKDLADEECEGGYIELDTAVWSPSNIKEFNQISGVNTSIINGVLSRTMYVDRETLKFKKFKSEAEKKAIPDFDDKYYTGLEAMNDVAAKYDYEATKDVYVLPYYMRQNTGDVQNPINTLYNSLIVTNNSVENSKANPNKRKVDPNKLQECYDRLLDNKNVKNHNFKPMTVHGGFAVDSLSDLVNGKSGIMRGYITGFSIPYSGRAVISPNINMEYGEVGIPSKMAAKIFKPTITDTLKVEGVNADEINQYISRLSRGNSSEEDVRKLDNIMTSNDCKVLVNRQPSLHMASMVCFKSRITEVVDSGMRSNTVNTETRDVIQLNPMLAKGFNADFDGDAVAAYALNDRSISDTAWGEMSPFTEFVSHNPKNLGESMTVPTKDCLFGLMSILGEED